MNSPGIIRELDQRPIEYRWNTRAILIDREEARTMLDKHPANREGVVRGRRTPTPLLRESATYTLPELSDVTVIEVH